MKDKQRKQNPYLSANFISKLTYWWLLEIFRLGKNNNLHADDIYEVLPEHISEILGDKLEKLWIKEVTEAKLKSRKPKLWKVIRKTFGWTLFKQGFGTFVLNVFRIIQLLTMARLISYFNPLSIMTLEEAYITATAFMLTSLFLIAINRQLVYSQYIFGMQVKIACSSLIYRKILKLSCPSAAVNGLIINVMSNDFGKFDKFFVYLPYTWLMPLMMVLMAYLIWLQLGVAAFAGILCMMLQIVPTQVIWFKLLSKLRAKSAAKTDKRVALIGEIIDGVRLIKMYAWENYFREMVCLVRRQEIDAIFQTFYIRGINFAMGMFTDRIALLCTILVYVGLGNEIAADKIFSTIGYFFHLRLIALKLYPEAVVYGSALKVALSRAEAFLLRDEITSPTTTTKSLDNSAVLMRNVEASWGSHSSVNCIIIHDIDLRIISQKMYAVIGPVGSGKSSLLKLILGELQPKTGEIWVYGKVSYASQEPWLFSGSVKENILFGEEYNEERYKKVAQVCQLLKDFEQLPFGDRTLVGERGMSLSGGQCARVNLARAVYKDTDIYLFDDPLSAVDSLVSKNLVEHCVNGFLKEKTRILVTHQMQFLKVADEIVALNEGQIEFQGDYETFVATEISIDYLSRNHEKEQVIEDEVANEWEEMSVSAVKEGEEEESKLEETEELVGQGRMKMTLILKYFAAGGSFLSLSLIMLLFMITQLVISGFDYWMSFWASQDEKRESSSAAASNTTVPIADRYLSDETALYASGGLAVAMIVLTNLKNVLFLGRSLNSSQNLHNSMFCRLLKAPMQFFNGNSSGRMLNRFSKDTGIVDEEMPISMLDVSERILITGSVIIQVLMINWWTIGPIVIAACALVKVTKIYLCTAQILKRLEGNAKSPVFSLVNSTLSGLPTIRSCCAQQIVRRDFEARQDANSAVQYLCLVSAVAYGLGLDLLACSVLAFMAYTFVPLKSGGSLTGSQVGLALTQFLSISTSMQYLMVEFANLACHLTAVERMFQYAQLEQEGPDEAQLRQQLVPRCRWPSRGEITFENVSLRYSENEQPVLRNLNFTISPSMKVGVVGRTAAGKSSLITALFRLVEPDGAIFIDKINTKQLALLELRSKISIIPQEPTLFSSSLRDNLDPLGQHDDASLWSALQDVQMHRHFDSLSRPIDAHLSAGQRQLLCLARAIVRKNKILLLDEPTANVDLATDQLIQRTIRTRFKHCTVLTIAHRLHTVADCDAIIVMEAGRIVEFDQPCVLLQNERGYLKEIVKKSGSASSLTRIAQKAYDESSNSNNQPLESTLQA